MEPFLNSNKDNGNLIEYHRFLEFSFHIVALCFVLTKFFEQFTQFII